MDLYNETHCVNCSCSWAFMELAREVWAICLELKRAALAMPIALLQINYSVVVKSQAIADNAHLMNLGVNLITTVTSVSLARMVYGAYQNVGHQWILNRVLQKFWLTVPKAMAQYTSFSLNLDLPMLRERSGRVQEGLRHHEEEDFRHWYVVMSKTRLH